VKYPAHERCRPLLLRIAYRLPLVGDTIRCSTMAVLRLASLALEGFKSFASRVELSFPGAIIAIVGPNGTGKSNIADAIASSEIDLT
jgi:hypothetical protein